MVCKGRGGEQIAAACSLVVQHVGVGLQEQVVGEEVLGGGKRQTSKM